MYDMSEAYPYVVCIKADACLTPLSKARAQYKSEIVEKTS